MKTKNLNNLYLNNDQWIQFPFLLSISLEYPNNSKQVRQSKFLPWQVN